MQNNNAGLIDSFEILDVFHESPDGVIYRAVNRPSDMPVLIKIYYPKLHWPDKFLDEFHERSEYLRHVMHENFLPIIGTGVHQGAPYLVFAADAVQTLLIQHSVVQQSREQEKEAVAFLSKIAGAVDWLHKQKIIHGSLSTENIAIDGGGNPRLFDFGFSMIFSKLLAATMGDGFDLLSTSDPRCTSPEQIQGLEATTSSDVYTFGVISYYYVTGEYPVVAKTAPETALFHISSAPLPAAKSFQRLSGNLADFIQKCIQIQPERRFLDFEQIIQALDLIGHKRLHLSFERRFVEIRLPVSWLRLARYGALAMLLLAGLFAVYYLRSEPLGPLGDSVTPAPASGSTTVPPSEHTLEPTRLPGATSPADGPTIVPGATNIPSLEHKPAIRDEAPVLPGQAISLGNLSSVREISRLGNGRAEDIAVSSDNTHIAIATSSGVYIYRQAQMELWIDPKNWATSVQFSPDGKTLAIGLASGEIQLWDWEAESRTAVLSQHKQRVNRILFSENDYMYSASADAYIVVWNWRDGTIRRSIAAHSKPINDIAVSRDGRFIISCAEDRLVRIWNAETGTQILDFDFDDEQSMVNAVAISSDAAYFAAGGESGFVRQWNMITKPGSKLQLRTDAIPVGQQVWSLQYTRDDSNLLVGTYGGNQSTYQADLLHFPGVSSVFEVDKPTRDNIDIFGPAFEFDSMSVFDGSQVVSFNWDGKVMRGSDQLFSPMYDIPDRLDLSPDGMLLAAGGERNFTRVWDLRTGKTIYESLYEMPYGDPISPDSSAITVIVPTKLNTKKPITQLNYQLTHLAGSADNWELSEAIKDGHVSYARKGTVIMAGSMLASRSWDFESGEETYSSGYQYKGGCRITVSSNDKNEMLQITSPLGTFEWIPSLSEKLCPVISQFEGGIATFSRDQKLFVHINANGLLEAYDVEKLSVVWVQPLGQNLTCLAISPDGTIIAYGDASGTLTFLESHTGTPVGALTGNFGALTSIEFSEDGREITTAGQDGTVRLFGILSK